MGKQAIFTLMPGSFEQGFPVILRIREDGVAEAEIQVVGHLPPAVDLLESFINWQLAYSEWQSTYRQTIISQQRIIPQPNAVTNFSWIELSSQMQERVNNWLNSSSTEWRRIRDQLLRNLSETDDEIQVLIQTNDAQLRQLPWNLWDLFSEQYRNAEIALSLPEFRPLRHRSLPVTNDVRVLAILGDTTNIDVHQDRTILERLPQATIEFLEEPTREQLNRQLWEKHWDILFFAGHSDSHKNGEIGRIYINRNDCLTLDELGNALRTGIEQGLKLAIFNSCDGLGLAHKLATWGLPQSIVMRQPVPDLVAQEFLKNFLEAFARKKSLYLAVREAREKLQGLEKDFPYASWLPVICQNPAARPFSWSQAVQNSTNELIALSGQDRLENTDQTPLFSSTQPATELDPVSPPNSQENSDLSVAIAPDEPEPQQPRQRHLYHVIFKYFIILLIGVSIGWLIRNIFSNSPNSPSPRACDSPALDLSDINDISDIAFSSDGKYLATASFDNTVRVLEVVNETDLKPFDCQEHEDGVIAVKFSRDGKKLATASLDSTARLMEITDKGINISCKNVQHIGRIERRPYEIPRPLVAIDFSPDGKYLATASADTEGIVKIWETKNCKETAVLTLKNSVFVRTVSFSRDGKYLAIASLNNKAQVWGWEADKKGQKPILLPSEDVVDVIFSPKDNHVLATANADGNIQVWDITDEPKPRAQEDSAAQIMNLSFSRDGKYVAYVATTSSSQKASVWDWQHSKPIYLLPEKVEAVAFSPKNDIAVASSDGTVQVWTTNGLRQVKTFTPQKVQLDKYRLVDITFMPTDNSYLAIATADGKVEIMKQD